MIAEAEGCSIQEAKRKTTSNEFLYWIEHFNQKQEVDHPLTKQIALLTHQVYLLRFQMGGTPKVTSYEEWLFKKGRVKPVVKPKTKEEAAKRSKQGWFMMVGGKKSIRGVGLPIDGKRERPLNRRALNNRMLASSKRKA